MSYEDPPKRLFLLLTHFYYTRNAAPTSQPLPWTAKNVHEKKHEAEFKRRILEISQVCAYSAQISPSRLVLTYTPADHGCLS